MMKSKNSYRNTSKALLQRRGSKLSQRLVEILRLICRAYLEINIKLSKFRLRCTEMYEYCEYSRLLLFPNNINSQTYFKY